MLAWGPNEDAVLLAPPSAGQNRLQAEIVQGTWNTLASLLQDVRINHSGSQIPVAKQVLNGADVSAALKQVRGEGMPIMPRAALSA